MASRSCHLRLVETAGTEAHLEPHADREGLAILAVLLGVNLIPVVGEVAGLGSWGFGTVGLATACALLAGRELWAELRPLVARR
jgi:hypothetical protein